MKMDLLRSLAFMLKAISKIFKNIKHFKANLPHLIIKVWFLGEIRR